MQATLTCAAVAAVASTQKPVQLGLFAYRYVALTIMVLWCAAYLGIEPYNPANPIVRAHGLAPTRRDWR